MSLEEVLTFIGQNSHTGIRGGSKSRGFLDIWMVVVGGRIFARSWGLSERSWYTAFLEEGVGAIQCGGQEIAVKGKVPADLAYLGASINSAYLEKFTSEHSRPYAEGITQSRHMERTLELIPLIN